MRAVFILISLAWVNNFLLLCKSFEDGHVRENEVSSDWRRRIPAFWGTRAACGTVALAKAVHVLIQKGADGAAPSTRNLPNETWLEPSPRLLARLFRRQGGDDLLEARIAAERVPEGPQF